MKTPSILCAFRAVALIALVATLSGCATAPEKGAMKKLVAIADVCTTNGYLCARVTNSDAIAAAGFLPVLVPCLADTNAVAAIMDRVDALVLTGAIKESYNKKRDKFEFMLIDMEIGRAHV